MYISWILKFYLEIASDTFCAIENLLLSDLESLRFSCITTRAGEVRKIPLLIRL